MPIQIISMTMEVFGARLWRWKGRFTHLCVPVKAGMKIKKCVGWVGTEERLEDNCSNPGVRQPRDAKRAERSQREALQEELTHGMAAGMGTGPWGGSVAGSQRSSGKSMV